MLLVASDGSTSTETAPSLTLTSADLPHNHNEAFLSDFQCVVCVVSCTLRSVQAAFDSSMGGKFACSIKCGGMVQGEEVKNAVTEGLRSVNLLADKAGDKLVSSYR